MRNHSDVNEALPMAMQEGWHEEVDVLFRFKIIISNNRYCHRIRKKSLFYDDEVNEPEPMAMQEGGHEKVDVLFGFKICICDRQ